MARTSIPFSYYKNAPASFKIPLSAGDNAYTGDLFSSDKVNPDRPISAGLFRLEKGEALHYTYEYDEMKIIIEGSFIISDDSGQEVTAGPGDVFFFPEGVAITFSTNDYGLAFFTGQRKTGTF